VASHEATNTLHRAMCLAPNLPGGMVVEIAVDSITCYYIVKFELNYKVILWIKLNRFHHPPA
jgi:hypothetical protein